MGSGEDLAELAGELEGIAERLADLALERLRSAVDPDDPDAGASEEERRITRARRAVEKAINLLEGASRPSTPDDSY
jgi:hypothetical protein